MLNASKGCFSGQDEDVLFIDRLDGVGHNFPELPVHGSARPRLTDTTVFRRRRGSCCRVG